MHSWSRLHEHLGSAPGPIDFAMVRRCVEDQLPEADDLDWKEDLPNTQDPQTAAEFAKDVAAMANTRGGLIIYGVTDNPIAFKGIQKTEANRDRYAQWVRNHVQPYLAGLDLHFLEADNGSEAVLVVDVPASELAPHAVDFEPNKDKSKSQRATVTPYRDGSHTEWMAEHQIARAYAERLTQAAQWQASFNELRDYAAESLDGCAGPGNTWLVIVARPVRPIPRSAPRLEQEVAKRIVDNACSGPLVNSQQTQLALHLLAGGRSRITVGLNTWVVTNRAREGRQRGREAFVELHHDGSLVFVVNLSRHALRGVDQPPMLTGIVNSDVVEQACVDTGKLLLYAMQAERIDSPMRVQATVVSEKGLPLACVTNVFTDYERADDARELHRLRPVTIEVPVAATEEDARQAAAELAVGILNQFGVSSVVGS